MRGWPGAPPSTAIGTLDWRQYAGGHWYHCRRTRTYRVIQQESLRPPIVEGPSVSNAGGPEAGGSG